MRITYQDITVIKQNVFGRANSLLSFHMKKIALKMKTIEGDM
jgi:hypothetical protein